MSTVQPVQDQILKSNTVIIHKGLLGGVQVMLYDGHYYRMATNNLDLLRQARALVKDLDSEVGRQRGTAWYSDLPVKDTPYR